MEEEAAASVLLCASCGVAEVDDVKLKPCDGCDLVRYCSDACQEDHRSEHAGKCKERAAELRDEIYSGSRKTAIWATARSAACLFRKKLQCTHAASNGYATDVHTPMIYAKREKMSNKGVHSVDIHCQL